MMDSASLPAAATLQPLARIASPMGIELLAVSHGDNVDDLICPRKTRSHGSSNSTISKEWLQRRDARLMAHILHE
jgi:hypothetical protein